MKKLTTVLGLLTATLYADVYYAKAEPIERYVLKSNVSGSVVKADEAIEGKIASKESIIEIDRDVDELELQLTISKLALTSETLSLNQSTYKRKAAYYKAIKNLTTKSKTAIDTAYYDQAAAKEKVNTLLTQLKDLEQRKFTLEKNIKDKQVIKPDWYVYKLMVKKGEYVTLGTPMVEVANISQSKLTFFLSLQDAVNADALQIWLNGEKSPLKIEKIWKVSDSEHISSYQAQLIIDAPMQFSKLVKIELKRKEQ